MPILAELYTRGTLFPIKRCIGAVVTEFSTGITAGSQPYGITLGPDGNVWFTEFNGNRIGRITPSGVVTEFSVGISANAAPTGITTPMAIFGSRNDSAIG